MKHTHSKMEALKYYEPELQSYLVSPMFNHESRNLLFRLRTRTVSGIKSDFKGLYTDISCPLSCGDTDTLSHILTCTALTSQHKSSNISQNKAKYEDIYSSDVQKQKQVTELFNQMLQIRNQILSQPVVLTGPLHSSNTVQSVSSDVTYGN